MSKLVKINDTIVNSDIIKRISKCEEEKSMLNFYSDYYIKIEYIDTDYIELITYGDIRARDKAFEDLIKKLTD